MTRPRAQRGLSLVELMVGLTLGLVVTAAVMTVFAQTRDSFKQDELIAALQANGRYALGAMARDLAMAGFWGGILDPAAIVADAGLTLGSDCGDDPAVRWAYTLTPAVELHPAAAPFVTAAGSCFGGGADIPRAGAVLALKRVEGERSSALGTNHVYLRTDGAAATLLRHGAGTAPRPAGFADWEYRPVVYFIRDYSAAPGDGIPTLYRKRLLPAAGRPSMVTESGSVAEGVERFNLLLGFDRDGDGIADYYRRPDEAPAGGATAAEAVSARIYLLARSLAPDYRHTDGKRYDLGEATPLTFDDHYYRRLFTTTVQLRNLAYRRVLGP